MTSQYAVTLHRPRLAVVRSSPTPVSRSCSSMGAGVWDEETTPPPKSDVALRSFRPAEVGDMLGGRFLLKRMAGSGGMGEVFEAIDTTNGATVAVKVLSEERACMASRLEREALVLASFKHPGIVGYVAHGSAPNPYLVMEWLDGEDLSRRLSREPLTLAETLALGVQVGGALATIHARGVIHRDIKPGNIFLVDGDPAKAKILDLGLARVHELPSLTKVGTLVGTLGYVAPEQAQQATHLDARADVFSLGCVIFKCLTGTPVFAAESLINMISKILYEKAPALQERCPSAPPELDALVARMLAKKPEDRPQDVMEVVVELSRMAMRR